MLKVPMLEGESIPDAASSILTTKEKPATFVSRPDAASSIDTTKSTREV
jgi:hypothetical protein